jgi:hypothetical protein
MEFKPKDVNKYFRYHELLNFLKETDFKILKCYEAQLIGEQPPYNVNELVAQRKAWRKELNELENEENKIQE